MTSATLFQLAPDDLVPNRAALMNRRGTSKSKFLASNMVELPQLLGRLAPALFPGVFVAMLCIGCEKPAQEATKPTPASESKAVASSATTETEAAAVAGPGKDQKSCFACNGEGAVACRVPGCRNGKVDCPGACLKLTRGTWVHMNMAGHDPKDLWQKFPDSTGQGSQAWNQQHMGEVIVMQNSRAVNIGACKVCGGRPPKWTAVPARGKASKLARFARARSSSRSPGQQPITRGSTSSRI
jgi:hypothetical protein